MKLSNQVISESLSRLECYSLMASLTNHCPSCGHEIGRSGIQRGTLRLKFVHQFHLHRNSKNEHKGVVLVIFNPNTGEELVVEFVTPPDHSLDYLATPEEVAAILGSQMELNDLLD